MRIYLPLIFIIPLIPIALADAATLSVEQPTLLQGTPQTVTATISKTLFEMTDIDLELNIQGPAYFEPRNKKATIHHDLISDTQADTFTLFLDDKYDGVTSDINITYKLTYDTRTGPHIEKGQTSFQGIWSEQSDCITKLNLCRATLNSKEKEQNRPSTPQSQGANTTWILILCILCLILGGFLGYKITHHFYPPKQRE